jgi:hypothetical protein
MARICLVRQIPIYSGSLGAALLTHALAKKWVARGLNSRELFLARFGEREILVWLGPKPLSEADPSSFIGIARAKLALRFEFQRMA